MPGTNTLLSGPSGVGKTTTAMFCIRAALDRGEKATWEKPGPVCTENLVRVDDVMESPKLAE
jgi:hypothetical protein